MRGPSASASVLGLRPPAIHAFEFMDVSALPRGLRHTLREILECGNGLPFRPYYDRVAAAALQAAERVGAKAVVELGAGTAPITARLAETLPPTSELRLIASDRDPDLARLASLSDRHPRVDPWVQTTDIGTVVPPEDSVVVLSASLHHVPLRLRRAALQRLGRRGTVVIAEPLRRNWTSLLFVGLSLIPALLTPLRFCGREGRLRRTLWCWLCPVAPLLFVWDGLVSCLRQWSAAQWWDTDPSSLDLRRLSVVATYEAKTERSVTRTTTRRMPTCALERSSVASEDRR